jgi:hypothetical protein
MKARATFNEKRMLERSFSRTTPSKKINMRNASICELFERVEGRHVPSFVIT